MLGSNEIIIWFRRGEISDFWQSRDFFVLIFSEMSDLLPTQIFLGKMIGIDTADP